MYRQNKPPVVYLYMVQGVGFGPPELGYVSPLVSYAVSLSFFFSVNTLGSTKTWKDSKRYTPHGAVQRYCCQNCGYHFQRSDICVSLISQAKRISPNGPANHLRTLIRFFPPFMYRFQGFFIKNRAIFLNL